jgi:hypothetical protein
MALVASSQVASAAPDDKVEVLDGARWTTPRPTRRTPRTPLAAPGLRRLERLAQIALFKPMPEPGLEPGRTLGLRCLVPLSNAAECG